jgi:hypothetical protein
MKFIAPFLLFLLAGVALAAPPQAVLTWTAPTTNSDGSAITATLTYNLYQGLTGALVKVQTGVATLSATITTGLTAGTSQCFAVSAVENGVEGAQSNTACATIPQQVPGQPTQITVVLH